MSIDSLEFKQFLSAFEPDLKNQFLKYGKIKSISEDKIVLDIREQINYLPIIIKGLARVTRRDGQGNSILLHYLTPFDLCTISFLNAYQGKPNTIRITSKTALVYYMFPINLVKNWFFKYESWHKYVIKLAQEQNESLIHLINEKVFEKLDVILKNYLKYLSDKFNTKLIVTSHQDIARDLYVSRESISRTLKKMENKGLLKLGRNKIILS
jgi:CRP/FNR family transcriptional regulator, anaerobic regulatory protein